MLNERNDREWKVIATLTTQHHDSLVAVVNMSEEPKPRFSYRIGHRLTTMPTPGVWTPVFVRYEAHGAALPHRKDVEAAYADLTEQVYKVIEEQANRVAPFAYRAHLTGQTRNRREGARGQ